MSDDAYADLFKKMQNAEKKKLQCVCLATLSEVCPYDFIKGMSPWTVRNTFHTKTMNMFNCIC